VDVLCASSNRDFLSFYCSTVRVGRVYSRVSLRLELGIDMAFGWYAVPNRSTSRMPATEGKDRYRLPYCIHSLETKYEQENILKLT